MSSGQKYKNGNLFFYCLKYHELIFLLILKKHNLTPMKRIYKSTLLIALLLWGFFFTQNIVANCTENNPITKEEAINQINTIVKNSDYNTLAIKKIEKLAKKTSCNFQNFVLYAEFAANFGYHTNLYLFLAEETSKQKEEQPLLMVVARLIPIPTIGKETIEDVIKMAIAAKTQPEKEKVEKKIEEIKTVHANLKNPY
jgi:hypothetical protein